MIDRGEAATMEEAQQLLSKQGHAASLQKIIDRGEAATMAEAQALAAQNMRAAIDAKYSKESSAS